MLPSRSFFRPVSLSLQEHTRAISDFLVKLNVDANRQGISVGGFYRENALELCLGARKMKPDCAFQLVDHTGRDFNYLVEMDCGSEPIRSKKQRESLEQKIRFYDEYQDQTDKRFRVLVLFTKSPSRLNRFCHLAKEVVRNPNRTLIYASLLSDYLNCENVLSSSLFLDRNNRLRSLIPQRQKTAKPQSPRFVKPTHLMANSAAIW